MINKKITNATKEETEMIADNIVKYNVSKVPFTQEPEFFEISKVIKNSADEIVAGIKAMLYCWNCLHIDVLWVEEEARGKGYGEALLITVEQEAITKGCKLVHLDTFDFQAKDFYLKQGYLIFGTLENCPEGHNRYYLNKELHFSS